MYFVCFAQLYVYVCVCESAFENHLFKCVLHSWQKRLLHPGMMCLFCDYFYFISPRGLRTGCVVWYNVFYVFDALIIYSVVFCQFWRHLMIKWVTVRMSIPKYHWKIIVVNLVEQRWFFFVTLPGGLVLCVPGQYRVFPPLAVIIAASRRGILATRRWRHCTGICTHLSSRALRSSSRFWGGLSIELIARPNSSQRCSMGLVRRSWRLLHLCDIALL